ncbi:MAG: hypothetical protein IJQ49_07760 [Prevotella sp.]|nr:hypothetical protein [Prevotella sp.]
MTELGFLMVSGGGPGAMEATHLGAWMAGRSDDEVEEALNIVASAPKYSDEGWISTAFEVMRRYPHGVLRWHRLYPRQCGNPPGDFPECCTEPLPLVRILQSDDIPWQQVLEC